MKKILQLDNVSLTYQTIEKEVNAIKDLSFSINEGQFVSIIGPSGCGKTSVLSLIAGLIKPTKGKILIEGKENSSNNLGYMLQKDHLFPWRTIEKNIFLPLEVKKIKTHENKQYALSLLEKYGLKDFKKSYPDQLSGGMRQRVALIRTLSCKPSILLLDEPFSALDYQTRLNVSDDICKQIRKEKITTILVTHDISEAISVADRVVILSKRPATIAKSLVIELDIDAPLHSPLLARSSPNFTHYFNLVWKELTT